MTERASQDEPAQVAVVGASGWIGRAVVEVLASSPHRVVCLSRRRPRALPADATWTRLEEDVQVAALTAALEGADAVINVAGAAHLPSGEGSSAAVFANEELPRIVGEASVAAGVARVVHLSSIKAAGEGGAQPLRAADPPRPTTAYGKSKLAGERAISDAAAAASGMRRVIVRPPMVYGPQAPANFARLARAATSWGPVPLPAPYPRRSLVYVGNLASLLAHLSVTTAPAARIVHTADVPHLTTRELVARIAGAAGATDRVVPVPVALVAPLARFLGRSDDVARLVQDLVVEPSSGSDLAGWAAPFPAHAGFLETFASPGG